MASFYVHPSSEVSDTAEIGEGTKIWNFCQIRENAVIGKNCIISKGVYIDVGVRIGNNVKIQNGISIYHGVILEDGVFCGPHCVFTNDKQPRAINSDGSIKNAMDWVVSETLVRTGASIGAHATILCGLTIGRWAMIGSGSVVTKNVPDYGLVYGNPAHIHGFVCSCGEKLKDVIENSKHLVSPSDYTKMICPKCGSVTEISGSDYCS